MDSRQLQEIDSSFRGLTGKWLFAYLRDTALESAFAAAELLPENQLDLANRERMLAKAAIYRELADLIPNMVSNELVQQLQKEQNT